MPCAIAGAGKSDFLRDGKPQRGSGGVGFGSSLVVSSKLGCRVDGGEGFEGLGLGDGWGEEEEGY